MGHEVVALAVVLAMGCSDGTMRIPGTLQGPVISLRATQAPALLAFRYEDADAWQIFTGATTVDVAIAGPYRVAVVCRSSATSGTVQIRELARTPDDGDTLELGCGPAPAPFLVTGELQDTADIALGLASTSTSSGAFEMLSTPGTFDLVVLTGDLFNGYDGAAIRRDVPVTGDTSLGELDLAHEGRVATTATTLGATNLAAGERLSVSGVLDTGTTQVWLALGVFDNPTVVPLLPNAALRATDHQRVQVSASGTTPGGLTSSRRVTRDYHIGDPTAFTLPEPLGPVAVDLATYRLSATWTSLPAYDTLSVARQSFAEHRFRSHQLTLTRSFIEAFSLTSATLDLRDVPGIDDDWLLDPTANPTYSLSVTGDGASAGIAGVAAIATAGSR